MDHYLGPVWGALWGPWVPVLSLAEMGALWTGQIGLKGGCSRWHIGTLARLAHTIHIIGKWVVLGPQGQYWPGNGAKWKYRTYIRCRKYMNQNQRCLTCPSQPLLETLKRCFLPFSWEIVFFCLFFAFFWSPPKFLPFWRVERFYGAHTELPGGKGVVGELFYLIFSVLLPKEKKCERFEISFVSEEAFFPPILPVFCWFWGWFSVLGLYCRN